MPAHWSRAPPSSRKRSGDLAVVEVVDALGYGVGEVGEGLDVVDEFLVARAVDGARLVRQPAGRLPPLPLPAVHQQDFLAVVGGDRPVAHHGEEAGGLGPILLFGEVHAHGLLGGGEAAKGKEESDGSKDQTRFLHDDLQRPREAA